MVSINRGTPQIIHFNGMFNHKPSVLGVLHLGCTAGKSFLRLAETYISMEVENHLFVEEFGHARGRSDSLLGKGFYHFASLHMSIQALKRPVFYHLP